MKGLAIALIGIVVIMAVIGMGLISIRNDLVRQENSIEAVDKDLQNVHASIFAQMKQQGVAVDKYGDMVIEAIEAAIEGRYGETGSKAAWSWIQEQNPTIDPTIMSKLQVAIEAGYNKFEAHQRDKIDRVRVYKNKLGVFPDNIVASLFGFPRIDMAMADRVITSAQTKQDFSTGELSDPGIFNNK